jgi:hypothetical protein
MKYYNIIIIMGSCFAFLSWIAFFVAIYTDNYPAHIMVSIASLCIIGSAFVFYGRRASYVEKRRDWTDRLREKYK